LIPRLYYNAQNNSDKFYISPDSKMISISALKSTFVSPQSQYYVVMDNNLVKDLIHEEPLLGANWNFSTDSEYALTRLNMNESYYFNILSKSDKSDYLNQLKNELAHSVPIYPSNIVAKGQYQWDNNVNHLQILSKFEILPGNDSVKDLTVVKVIDTLNDLITNRGVTMISKLPKSSNLDNQYGFILKKNVWGRYGYNLILIGIVPFSLAILTLLSYREKVSQIFEYYSLNIDILTLMNSKLADFSWFKAPLSNSSETWILRAGCINLFIEDAPQLVIQ
ncbi:11545_t:CDS:2, partial [Gigaspora margarita]